jgi:hypothetical protein
MPLVMIGILLAALGRCSSGVRSGETAPSPERFGVLRRLVGERTPVDSWMDHDLGTWYRFGTRTRTSTTYTDTLLVSRSPGAYTLRTVVGRDGMTREESERSHPVEAVALDGQAAMIVGDLEFRCEVRQRATLQGVEVSWVVRDGPHAGVVLRRAGPGEKFSFASAVEASVRVGERTIDCLVLNGIRNGVPTKVWACAAVPMGFVRRESDGSIEELVAWGKDPDQRPDFPR